MGATLPEARRPAAPHVNMEFARALMMAALLALCPLAHGIEPPADPVGSLRAKWQELQPQLRASAFGEPVYLSSREGSDLLEGEVYAEMGQPFAAVGRAFKSAATVCGVLLLHLNVHSCQPAVTPQGETLTLSVGPKRASALGSVYRMAYALRIEATEAAYLRVTLTAADGPMSTRDYRIVFEAVPIDGTRSFVHARYSYRYGMLASMAMQAYLATTGRSKIGFTVMGQTADGRPLYLGGQRASMERNVMRYYLALLAYGGVVTGSPQEQMQARLRAWFGLTERFAAQLHELDLDEYLREKNDDLARSGLLPQ